MGGKIFKSYLAEKKKFNGFEGAFVFPTKAGVYRGGVATFDFASLYPSNIRSINASPETYVGKVLLYRKDETGNITCNTENEWKFNPFNDNDTVIDKDDPEQTFINAGDKSLVKIELKLPNGQRKQLDI